MAAPIQKLRVALRGTNGISMIDGSTDGQPDARFTPCNSNRCRVMTFSDDGTLFAFCDGDSIHVQSVPDFTEMCQIDKPRTAGLQFSTHNNLLASWEPYMVTKDQPAGTPNLNIWDTVTGKHVKGLIQKKQQGWCPQWSSDELFCARNVNNELHFFENNKFDNIAHKLHLQKVSEFKISSKSAAPHHVAAYVPGTKGQPSFVRLYRYPNFGGLQAALANKSFYKADRVDLLWNNRGTGVLVQTATESSADSYYGEQGLHYVGIDGISSLVPRAKNGPVYCVEWSPKSTEFCVVYGSMPAKATLYNMKCEPVFDFGTGPRNLVYFNPQGNILSLAGFGNLRGNLEFWDLKQQKMISNPRAIDTTYFEWCPDGEHILTATTTPRLRVGNGFKIWHYTGSLLHETSCEELWEASWQPSPTVYAEPDISYKAVESAIPGPDNKPKAYVPPQLRGLPEAARAKFKDDYEPASNVKQQLAQQAAQQENLSKAALKNKKKREAKKAKKEQEQAQVDGAGAVPHSPPPATVAPPHSSGGGQGGHRSEFTGHSSGGGHRSEFVSTGDPETDKRIRNLRKKLQQIDKLKEQQTAGKQLELNQQEKLKSEASLVQELQSLQLS